MDWKIRVANKADMVHVHGLIQELAHFEKEPEAVEIMVEDLEVAGFGSTPLFHCFVAQTADDAIVGMALVYQRYSTWKGPVLHLEDLIVTEKMRGSGLGTALLNRVVAYGKQLGVKRVSWEVLDWNHPAIAFYESKGAHVMRDWHVVQLDAAAMANFGE